MTIGIWVLGDQLWARQAALASDPSAPIIFIESHTHSTERRYHRQKLVLVWSAMRHFAAELEAEGRTVNYEEDYSAGNYFDHHQPLPEFFWTGGTPMNCLHQSIDQAKRTGRL